MSSSTKVWIDPDGSVIAGTVAVAAAAVGTKERTLARWLAEGCPGERGRYPVGEIVVWARENKWQADDGDMAGGPSPALERYREQRAEQEAMRTKEMRGELVRLADLHDMLTSVSGLVRSAGESLRRQFGNEALQILNEALDEAERHIDLIGGLQ